MIGACRGSVHASWRVREWRWLYSWTVSEGTPLGFKKKTEREGSPGLGGVVSRTYYGVTRKPREECDVLGLEVRWGVGVIVWQCAFGCSVSCGFLLGSSLVTAGREDASRGARQTPSLLGQLGGWVDGCGWGGGGI